MFCAKVGVRGVRVAVAGHGLSGGVERMYRLWSG